MREVMFRSLPNIKAGADVKLYLDADHIRIMRGKVEIANIPAASVTEISYGQDVHRRVGAAGLLVSKQPILTHYFALSFYLINPFSCSLIVRL